MKLGVGNVARLHLSHLHAIGIPSSPSANPPLPFPFPFPFPFPPPTQKNDTGAVPRLLQLLKRCSSLSQVKQLHAHLVVTGPLAEPAPVPPSLLHALVRTYNAMGCLTHAVLLFDRSPPPPSNLLWNVLIRAYSKSTRPQESILLLRRMLLLTLPDNYTFTFSIAACSRVESPRSETGDAVHCLAIKAGCGGDCDLFVGNSLVGMYSVASRIDDARKVFEEMAARDVVSWTSLIDGYARVGELGAAKELFEEMPDRNNISWAVIISGHVTAGMYEDAINHFHQMMRCSTVKPNEAILVCVLSACAHMGALEQGKWLHAYIDKSKAVWSSNVSTALIDMYAKCGRIDCAKQVFDTALRHDIWTWTSLISGLAMHGLGSDALRIFNQMVDKGIMPDTVTLLGVLNGCSHSGLVKEGTAIFYEMDRLWGISPEIEHYGCLIDLLGRAGKVEKAFKTVMTMPLEPDVVIWRSLLSACRIHGVVGLAEHVLLQIAKLYPTSHDEGRVLLSNLYAAMDRWEGVSKMRRIYSSEASGQFSPGCSWIEVNGVVHKFLAAERFHSQIVDIRNKLVEVLNRVSHEGGYVPNTKNVLFDLSEEEKEQAVSWHSEKLAVAFGLMSTEQGSSIRIMKNLRICGDCHSLIKAVSLVFHREIVVRDRSRFHTFLGGNCSCNDYWEFSEVLYLSMYVLSVYHPELCLCQDANMALEKTGAKIMYRVGGVVFLFRGRNYDPRTRSCSLLCFGSQLSPMYPKLIKQAPKGLTKLEADDMRSIGQKLPLICILAKNGIYINLVKDVRDAFEGSPLAKIDCRGLQPSDYKKIGAKLKDLVPCVLLSFDEEQILIWRGKDWKSRYQMSNTTTSSTYPTK